MDTKRVELNNIRLSLADLVGVEYVTALCEARAFLEGGDIADYRAIGEEKVDFFPAAYAARLDGLLPDVGQRVVPGYAASSPGAANLPVNKATKLEMSPIGGMGFYRVGEDGRLYLITKSEHYHAPLGHDFPGYRLLQNRGAARHHQRHAQQHARPHHPPAGARAGARGKRPAQRAIRRRSTASAPPMRRMCSTASPISKRAASPSKLR